MYIWFSQSADAWIISADVGGSAPTLARSGAPFARPELTTVWQIQLDDHLYVKSNAPFSVAMVS